MRFTDALSPLGAVGAEPDGGCGIAWISELAPGVALGALLGTHADPRNLARWPRMGQTWYVGSMGVSDSGATVTNPEHPMISAQRRAPFLQMLGREDVCLLHK